MTKPATSISALSSISATDLEEMVFEAIDVAGPDGCISDEVLECYPAHSYSSITARFSALEKKGLIIRNDSDTRPGKSGRAQMVMRAAHYVPGAVSMMTPPAFKKTGFLAGLMFAAQIVLKASDMVDAKRQLGVEIRKVSKR